MTQNQKDKEMLLEEMKSKDISFQGRKGKKGEVKKSTKMQEEMGNQEDEDDVIRVATAVKDE